jgi:hypothetical protein
MSNEVYNFSKTIELLNKRMKNLVIVISFLVLVSSCSVNQNMYKGRYYDIEIVKSVGDSVVISSWMRYKYGKHILVNLDEYDLVIKDYKEKKNRKN